jgi:hypothetical protein
MRKRRKSRRIDDRRLMMARGRAHEQPRMLPIVLVLVVVLVVGSHRTINSQPSNLQSSSRLTTDGTDFTDKIFHRRIQNTGCECESADPFISVSSWKLQRKADFPCAGHVT